MKEFKLMKLTLRNFKGVDDFTLDLSGESAEIFGKNDAGKTTLYDSFLWLMFDKNSLNETKFTIKKFDAEGEAASNLEHEVEATVLVDGKSVTLKKVHFENWSQNRNSIDKKFKGNTNKYLIDEVPVKKKEYDEYIDSLIKEETFKLLTSPTYFNLHRTDEQRLQVLFDILGGLSDEEVISTDKDLEELSGILKDKTVEKLKLEISAKQKAINKEIKDIPIRISEVTKSLPEGNVDVPSIEKEIAVIEKEINEHTTQINNIENGSAITGKKQELQQIVMDLEAIKRELESESVEQANKVNTKIQEEQSNIAVLERKKDDAEYQIKRNNDDFSETEAKLVPLRAEHMELEASVFTHEIECVCPTCEQDLPEIQVEAAKEKALASFNLKKAQRREEIQELGQAGAKKKASLLEQNEKLTGTVDSVQSQIDEKEKAIDKLGVEIVTLREAVKDARQDPRYQSKLQEQVKANEEIIALQENAVSAVVNLEKVVAELRSKRGPLDLKIAEQEHFVKSKERIAELEAQQEKLAEEFAKLSKQTYLVEKFTRAKTELLDAKIQSKFNFARFKLTDRQVDGTLIDTCKTMYKGVPYNDGLNSAAKLNAGLDICETLQKHYGVKVPVWIDNRESVVDLLEIDTQMITLTVSGKDEQLRVELVAKKESDVA